MNFLTIGQLREAIEGIEDNVVVHLCQDEVEYMPLSDCWYEPPEFDDDDKDLGVFVIRVEYF